MDDMCGMWRVFLVLGVIWLCGVVVIIGVFLFGLFLSEFIIL